MYRVVKQNEGKEGKMKAKETRVPVFARPGHVVAV
jgi:hypothetical protein